MASMIEIRDLRKTFGPITAVDGVSLDVDRGDVLGFLGPNGAGKSTAMKMVTGFLTPTAGTARVCDEDVTQDPLAVKRSLGYLPEGAPLYPDMTPESLLKFVAEVRGLRGKARREALDKAAAQVHLEGVMRQPIETLSKGYKRRVGLAQAIIHDPDVLILDEPTDGLDPNQKHEVRTLIRRMAERKAMILSTHILEEVDAVCNRAVIISRGRVVADGSPEQLQARSPRHNAVSLAVRADLQTVAKEIGALDHVAKVERLGSDNGVARCRVYPKDSRPIVTEVSQHVRERGWSVDEMVVEPGRLDEVFREVTEGELAGGAPAEETR